MYNDVHALETMRKVNNLSIDPKNHYFEVFCIQTIVSFLCFLLSIPAEAPKVDIRTNMELLYPLFSKILEEQRVPIEWKEAYLIKSPKMAISAPVSITEV